MWRHRLTILCTAIVVGCAGTAWVAHLPDRYRASALLVLKVQNFPEEYVRLMTTERAEAQIHVVREVVLSRSLLGRVVDDFHLYDNLRTTNTPEEILDAMRRDVTIRLKGNDVFMIAYQGDDAKTVAAVTNHLAELFVGVLRNEVKSDPVRHQAQFLETRRKDLEKQLADLLLVYTPNYPEVIGIKRQIQEVAAELDEEQGRIYAGSAPADGPDAQRRPDAGVWQEAKILDRAVIPEKPSGPHRVLLALAAFVLGAGMGMAWGLIRSLMDQSFRDVYDVEAVTRIPVLGVVCRLAAPRQGRRLFRLILGLGSGVATAGGAWYLAWHFPEVGRWVAQWWRNG
jgi:uncharacterized protein involved in exopolysaccharide biosynthesis